MKLKWHSIRTLKCVFNASTHENLTQTFEANDYLFHTAVHFCTLQNVYLHSLGPCAEQRTQDQFCLLTAWIKIDYRYGKVRNRRNGVNIKSLSNFAMC